jgi:hypothetical protein
MDLHPPVQPVIHRNSNAMSDSLEPCGSPNLRSLPYMGFSMGDIELKFKMKREKE